MRLHNTCGRSITAVSRLIETRRGWERIDSRLQRGSLPPRPGAAATRSLGGLTPRQATARLARCGPDPLRERHACSPIVQYRLRFPILLVTILPLASAVSALVRGSVGVMYGIGSLGSPFQSQTAYLLQVLLQADEALLQTGWFAEPLCSQMLPILVMLDEAARRRSYPLATAPTRRQRAP